MFKSIARRWKMGVTPVENDTEELIPDLNELIALKDRKSRMKLSSEHSIRSTTPGDHHSPFRGQGLEFDAVREYVPGDDVRNIDWRVTARMDAPHMKLFREEKERQVLICVDVNASMRFGTRQTFKSVQAARVAAILGWRALGEHDRVGACLFGDIPRQIQYFAPRRTRKSLWSMLRLLSSPPQEKHAVSIDEALRHLRRAAQTGSLIYVISDFMEISGELVRLLSRLSKHCDVVCLSVNDPAEKELWPVGALEFYGSDQKPLSVDTQSVSGRNTYIEQWVMNREKLREAVTRSKVSLIELSTERDVHRDLVLGLRALSKRRRS